MKSSKLVFGVGIKGNGVTGRLENGRFVHDKLYGAWSGMLMRCYSEKYKSRYPTYEGCTVCDEWKHFEVFRAWTLEREWNGLDLDKDLITPGNKLYSPEHCAFVPQWLNKFFGGTYARGKNLPVGVSVKRTDGGDVYIATIQVENKSRHLGRFASVDAAESAYLKEKIAQGIATLKRYRAEHKSDERVESGFLARLQAMNARVESIADRLR